MPQQTRPPIDQIDPTEPESGPDSTPAIDTERRAALHKLGAMAALTPPTVLTLLMSKRASAQSLGGPPLDP